MQPKNPTINDLQRAAMDPFAPGPITQAPLKAAYMPNWSAIPPIEMEMIIAIGKRANALLELAAIHKPGKILPPSWQVAACDVACTHLQKPLKLFELLHADDLRLLAEYIEIASQIERARHRLRDTSRLRFVA